MAIIMRLLGRRRAVRALEAARAAMGDLTPLKQDCGRLCGAACCQPDETGLNGMLRYVSGDNIELARFGGSNLSESEKDIEVWYVLQSGPLKDLSLRLRNAWYRNDFTAQASHRDDNELRLNIDYTWKWW